MSTLDQRIRIKSTYTRSINLSRDCDTPELLSAYLPTSRALQALTQIADGFGERPHERALALIGPYGSGKSIFALFLAALLSPEHGASRQRADAVLRSADPVLADRFTSVLAGRRAFLRVQVNGTPDSLVRQLLLALAVSVEKERLPDANDLVEDVRTCARPGVPMDRLLVLFQRVQDTWADQGGCGILIEIDELGKFLEYESYHPEHREIHLLQLLAERAHTAHRAPLQLVVLLHQAFEQYGARLGKHLREEWQKIQGRFSALAFLEPAAQSLGIIAAAFEPLEKLPQPIKSATTDWATHLDQQGALPLGLDKEKAREWFRRCYPLHPITLLILPILCQKVAQNERTLYSYLGSGDPFGLRDRLVQLRMGEWIEPWQLYDYFMLNPTGGFSDPMTYHRWIEVTTALERADRTLDDLATQLLKTIGLLNIIGAQRGLKASRVLLYVLFGQSTDGILSRLEGASLIRLRHFNQEYCVWQGSDFDLAGAVRQAADEVMQTPIDEWLNTIAPLKPIVARRATIDTGSLRSFEPIFTTRLHWPPPANGDLKVYFYLADNQEQPIFDHAPPRSVVALCGTTDRLREAVAEWVALRDLHKHHAALQQDPVAQREHRIWLHSAEEQTVRIIRAWISLPESLRWFWGGQERSVSDRRDLQQRLSEWVEQHVDPQAPLFRNELINRDAPSTGIAVSAGAACSSGKVARSHVLAAMGLGPLAESAIRVSLPWNATAADVASFIAAYRDIAARLLRSAA